MRSIRFDPADQLAGLRSAIEFQRMMDGLLEGGMAVLRHAAAVWHPALDVCESAESYFLTVELAGVRLESLEVTVQERAVTIRGTRPREPLADGASCHVMEISYGPFEREVRLPDPVDNEHVSAELHDGFLRITLRKVKARRQRRRVPVQ